MQSLLWPSRDLGVFSQGSLSSEFLFSSDIDFRKFGWWLNDKVGGQLVHSRKDQYSENGSQPCGKSALEIPPALEATWQSR